MSSKVFFTKEITPDAVCRMYGALGCELPGRVAVKVHSGEKGNQNFLRPEFWKSIIDSLSGTVVECNTAYNGMRNTTEKHVELLSYHGWSKYFPVDILDAEGPDLAVPVSGGVHLKENLLGKNIENYDSMLVLSHFKGHPMGGYGGALKQLSIGCASAAGKCRIHTAGATDDVSVIWKHTAEQDDFLDSMAEAASTVEEMFKGRIAYINIMCNLSVDCDCCAVAEDPCMKDIGILASLDPVALDKACVDKIYESDDPGRDHFVERIESRHGLRTIETAEKIGCGTSCYELIEI